MQAPQFYESVPPAPPGLEWWHYRADVPPLPEPAKFLHDRRYKDWGVLASLSVLFNRYPAPVAIHALPRHAVLCQV
jgi:hypothetical protein